jgi:apolipoprotein N-acyltransferase
VTVRYGHAPALVGVLAPMALAAYIAVFVAAFGAGWRWLAQRGAASPLAAALLWTALEHLRSFALSGFPWATLGCVYGLSFVTVLGGAALADVVSKLRAGSRAPGASLAAIAVVVAFHLLGIGLRVVESTPPLETVRMAALQGNVDQGLKWDLNRLEETLELYEDLATRAADRGARVIVLPETALPIATLVRIRARARRGAGDWRRRPGGPG